MEAILKISPNRGYTMSTLYLLILSGMKKNPLENFLLTSLFLLAVSADIFILHFAVSEKPAAIGVQ